MNGNQRQSRTRYNNIRCRVFSRHNTNNFSYADDTVAIHDNKIVKENKKKRHTLNKMISESIAIFNDKSFHACKMAEARNGVPLWCASEHLSAAFLPGSEGLRHSSHHQSRSCRRGSPQSRRSGSWRICPSGWRLPPRWLSCTGTLAVPRSHQSQGNSRHLLTLLWA